MQDKSQLRNLAVVKVQNNKCLLPLHVSTLHGLLYKSPKPRNNHVHGLLLSQKHSGFVGSSNSCLGQATLAIDSSTDYSKGGLTL